MKRALIAAAVALILIACDRSPTRDEPEPTAAAPAPITSQTPHGRQRFDRLTLELRLKTTTVATGKNIGSQLEIENRSERPVVDPSCLLSSPSFALVPADDPDAELWSSIVVDCNGPFTMEAGFVSMREGPTFRATDKLGDPLPPGDYIATMQLPGRTEPLTVPVEVTP